MGINATVLHFLDTSLLEVGGIPKKGLRKRNSPSVYLEPKWLR